MLLAGEMNAEATIEREGGREGGEGRGGEGRGGEGEGGHSRHDRSFCQELLTGFGVLKVLQHFYCYLLSLVLTQPHLCRERDCNSCS